jgi:hypothetical protein
MALQFSNPPADAAAAVTSFLERARTAELESVNMLGAAGPAGGAPALRDPHPVFTFDLGQLASGAGPEAGLEDAWRYAVPKPGGSALAEVRAKPDGGFGVAGLSRGPVSNASGEILSWLRSLPEIADAPFEVRAFRVPGLYVEGFWLHAPAGQDDRYVLLQNAGRHLEARRLYTAGELFPVLQTMAARRLEFDDTPRESRPRR